MNPVKIHFMNFYLVYIDYVRTWATSLNKKRWENLVSTVQQRKITPSHLLSKQLMHLPTFSSQDTVLPAKSDSDIMFCLQLLSKTLTCTLQLS